MLVSNYILISLLTIFSVTKLIKPVFLNLCLRHSFVVKLFNILGWLLFLMLLSVFINSHFGILLFYVLILVDFGIHIIVLPDLGLIYNILILFILRGVLVIHFCVLVDRPTLLTHSLLLMAISVSSLGERLATKLAFERHVIVVDSQMVSQVA